MRFFSSSALASAPKLRFAASCSAAETMFGFLPPSLARDGLGIFRHRALSLVFEHDHFWKPVRDFPDHAQRRHFSQAAGNRAHAGHYLGLGPDKSIAKLGRSSAGADDDAVVTLPHPLPSSRGRGFSPCRRLSPPRRPRLSRRREPRCSPSP